MKPTKIGKRNLRGPQEPGLNNATPFHLTKRNMGMTTNDELCILLMSERKCIATNFPTSNRYMREQPARENFIFVLERQ